MAITDQMIIPPNGGNISILKADGRHVLTAEKPQFSFPYNAITFINAVQEYLYNNQTIPMTEAQVQEVSNFLNTVEPDPVLGAKVIENRRNRQFLQQTDWYVVRQVETGVPIPPDILELRAQARAAILPL